MPSIISEQTILLPPSPPTVVEEVVNSHQLINLDTFHQDEIESPPQPDLLVRENIEIQEQLIPGKFEYIIDVHEKNGVFPKTQLKPRTYIKIQNVGSMLAENEKNDDKNNDKNI